MPSNRAVRREQLAVAAIRSASALQVSVDGWPEQEHLRVPNRYPAELTVEAVLRLSDGDHEVLWAADVMGIGWNPRLRPATEGFEEGLEKRLLALAEARGRGITVMYKPPVGHKDKGAAYCDSIVKYASDLIDGTSRVHFKGF